MFGIGLSELAVIAFVAVLLVGPERLPDFARQAGRMLRQLRNLANSARDDLREELGPEFADLELRDLDPRQIVRKHIMEAMEEGDEAPTRGRPRRQPSRQPGRQPRRELGPGEAPPYDPDAT